MYVLVLSRLRSDQVNGNDTRSLSVSYVIPSLAVAHTRKSCVNCAHQWREN